MFKKRTAQIKLPAKASVWYLGSAVAGKAVGILTTPFFTRLLSDGDYGRFTLYMSLLGGGSVICSAVNTGSGVYGGLAHFSDKKGSFLKSLLATSLGFSTVICLLLFAFSHFFGVDRVFLLPLSLQLLCDSVMAVLYSEDRFSYRYKEVGLLSLISALLPPVLSLVILLHFGGGYGVRVYALLFVSLLTSIYALIKLLSRKGSTNGEMVKYALGQAAVLLPHGVCSALSAQADKLIITSLMGAEALAKYSVVHSLGIAALFLTGALGAALNPWIVRRLCSGEEERVGRLFTLLLSAVAVVTLFIIGLAPEAMTILAPKDYAQALGALLPIALSVLPSFVISTATVGLVHRRLGGYTAAVSLISALSCIILNYMLLPPLGFSGAGIALLASQLIGALACLIFLRRCGLAGVISPIRSLLILLCTAAFGIFLTLLYPYLPMRLLLLVLPAAFGLEAGTRLLRAVKESDPAETAGR